MSHIWWICSSLGRDYNFCSVAWRVLFRVRSRCVSNSISVRSFCSVSAFPSVLVAVVRHQWERVMYPPSQFGSRACVCVIHVFRVGCCHSPVCLVLLWRDFLCLDTLVFQIVLHYWVIRGIHQHVLWILVLFCCVIVSKGLSLFLQCWVVLVYIVTVMFVPWLEACLLSFASPFDRYLLWFLFVLWHCWLCIPWVLLDYISPRSGRWYVFRGY